MIILRRLQLDAAGWDVALRAAFLPDGLETLAGQRLVPVQVGCQPGGAGQDGRGDQIPEPIRRRFFERPDAFRLLARLDDKWLDEVLASLGGSLSGEDRRVHE